MEVYIKVKISGPAAMFSITQLAHALAYIPGVEMVATSTHKVDIMNHGERPYRRLEQPECWSLTAGAAEG